MERMDYARLEALLEALDASPRALRREQYRGSNERGDYAINGKSGHIYADGAGYLLCVTTGESTRRWTNIKCKLAFCRLTQDGDDEGCLHLDRLPTPAEADLIREVLGIRRKRRYQSPETLASVRATLAKFSVARPQPGPSGDQGDSPSSASRFAESIEG
jgi:hypothetical protein